MSADAPERMGMPIWLVFAALVGAVSALAGGYWDDAWHTERGRDAFFIAPHIAIYGGVALVGGALALWVLRVARGEGVRSVPQHPTLLLAAVSVAVTLASGPIDNAWHEAFGRDSVIWSPPHMLGIVGTLALGAAILSEVRERVALATVTGALVLAAAAFTVVEYETDVPQFDSVWYLPALSLATAIAFALIRLTAARPWAATEAAAAHLLFVGTVSAFLLALDFDPPALPLLILPAAVLDLAVRRGWPAVISGLAFSATIFAVHVPVRNWLGFGVEIDAVDVVVGLPLAVLASAAVLAFGLQRTLGADVRRATAATATLLFLAAAAPVWAHDPGQGEDAGTAALTVISDGRDIVVAGSLRSDDCSALRSGEVVARRGGAAMRKPLAVTGCAFHGQLDVSERGRWFVYAELEVGSRMVESWLPIHVNGGDRRSEDSRYAYEPPERESSAAKYVGGAVLYAMMAALLWATFRLVGRNLATRPPRAAAAAASLRSRP